MTRKYLLCGYILGVLMHTTTLDQNWGGDETLKWVLLYATKFQHVQYCDARILASLYLIEWTSEVWGWPRMHNFYSLHIPKNFCLWHIVIRLQKLELVFGHMDGKMETHTDAWRDRNWSWYSYLDIHLTLKKLPVSEIFFSVWNSNTWDSKWLSWKKIPSQERHLNFFFSLWTVDTCVLWFFIVVNLELQYLQLKGL